MSENSKDTYKNKPAIPNKLLQSDGSITDLMGNVITDSTEVYDNKVSIPNKFLNPDGTITTLEAIIGSAIDSDLFVIVEELPEEGDPTKIYLVPNGEGGFTEYHYANGNWDPIGIIDIDLSGYYTKDQTDSNFLKKTNTTAYTPTANYHPATKKYVDEKAVTFKAFPQEFDTTHSTQTFLTSIENQSLPVGMAYLGQVSLSDMPEDVSVQAEVEVYVYPQNVIYCVMRSAEVSPYQWECNSYEYRGWEAIDKTAKDYADTNFLKKNNTTAYTPTGNYNPATKKYVDDAITTNITNALGGSY